MNTNLDDASNQFPSPATIFRMKIVDQASDDLLRRARAKLAPLLKLREGGTIKKIRAAATVEDLLDLSPQAKGLAQDAWHDRMRQFGPPALPLIGETLKRVSALPDEAIRQRIQALLVAELRWQGMPGVQVLLDGWDELDDFSTGLASVVLGLLECRNETGRIWEYYQRVKPRPSSAPSPMKEEGNTGWLNFVGGLWGLIDLEEQRVASELHDLLLQPIAFYELFGFLSRAGHTVSLATLMALAEQRGRKAGIDPLMAAVGIAHRAGRQEVIQALLQTSTPEESDKTSQVQATEIADLVLSTPQEQVQEYFALFYRGFRPQDAADLL